MVKQATQRSPRVKPFKQALEMQLKMAGTDMPALRKIAHRMIMLAEEGESWAAKEIIDRLDGKTPQALIGGDDEDTQLQITVNYNKPKQE